MFSYTLGNLNFSEDGSSLSALLIPSVQSMMGDRTPQ